jgi:hypothetical protein
VLFIDWLCVVEAKLILDIISKRETVLWLVIFVTVDLSSTLFILIVIEILYNTPILMYVYGDAFWDRILGSLGEIADFAFHNLTRYFFTESSVFSLIQVVLPSTMLTSIWVILFTMSVVLLKLLAPLEYIRRFTLWWFKDLDAHPLRAIAKVAATLIVIGAFVLKAVRWGWLLV